MAQFSKKKRFQLTLRGAAPWISEISYEKCAKDLTLYFTLSDGSLSEQDIIFSALEATEEYAKDGVPKLVEKIEYLPAADLYAAWLTQEDMTVAGLTPKQLPLLWKQLASQLSGSSGYIVLFPEHTWHTALLLGGKKKVREATKQQFSAQERADWIIAHIPETTFAEAKQLLITTLSRL